MYVIIMSRTVTIYQPVYLITGEEKMSIYKRGQDLRTGARLLARRPLQAHTSWAAVLPHILADGAHPHGRRRGTYLAAYHRGVLRREVQRD